MSRKKTILFTTEDTEVTEVYWSHTDNFLRILETGFLCVLRVLFALRRGRLTFTCRGFRHSSMSRKKTILFTTEDTEVTEVYLVAHG